ncbi:C40 family peptidase [Gorillibacterium sp. sgz5001074]|uniref:C40 family peptidase n=1 Tax=Gorillibacterium sp. sgz5001074 TaxID=3446695 RepID=UPI003F68071D
MKPKALRPTMAAVMAMTLTLSAACTDQGNKSGQGQGASPSPGASAQAQSQSQPQGGTTSIAGGGAVPLQVESDGSVPIRHISGTDYVQATKLLEIIGFRNVWDANQSLLKFGNHDAAYEIKMNTTEARKEEEKFNLSHAAIPVDGIPYLPVSAISDLLSEEVSFTRQGDQLVFHAQPNPVHLKVDEDGPLSQGDALNFGEDPDDPFKDATTNEAPSSMAIDADGAVTAAALKNINIPSLIARAKTYLGVKYDFGASPYPQSGKFDCSSYTQYLFGKYGVTLPRTARAQAKLGNTVSRTSLRRGDLVYFYVPGRFKSNKTVGHVGIYIGDMKMINASPLPKDGVQIISLNKAYWKETFLFAKRIVY